MSHTEDHAARPLVVTADEALLDDLLRLAAAAGIAPEVITDAGSARRAWATAPIVVIGDDLAATLGSVRPPRRDGVVVVRAAHRDGPADGPIGSGVPLRDSPTGAAITPTVGSSVWVHAVAVGAEDVLSLPDREADLIERFGACLDGARRATTIAVIGGSGGCGASTFAAAIAFAGADRGLGSLLVDADPLSGGLDLHIGSEGFQGMHWPDLAAARGRLAAPALRDALPRVRDVAVLTWGRDGRDDRDHREGARTITTDAMRSVLAAGQRGHDLVVIDAPRRIDPAAEEALSRADHTILVVRGDLLGVAAATRVVHHIGPIAQRISVVVVRAGSAGIPASLAAESLGLPLATAMRPDRRLAADLEAGLAPTRRRGPLAASCRTVLDQLGLADRRAV